MTVLISLLLYPVVMFVIIRLAQFFLRIAMILAARRTIRDLDRKSLHIHELPMTRDEALEYLRQPELEMAAGFLRKTAVYRFLLETGLVDGAMAFLCFIMQNPNPMVWYVCGGIMLLFAFIVFMSCLDDWKKAGLLTDPNLYEAKEDDDLVSFAQKVHHACSSTFSEIERMSGRPWKKFCAVSIAAAVFLTAAQMDYQFRAKNAGDGILEMGAWQYRVLDDRTVEVVRYTGIWKAIAVPSTLQGMPVSSVGPLAFKRERGHDLPFVRQPLTSVLLPDGLIRIGDRAFEGCWELPEVKIPDSVTWIGNEAFDGCTMLKEIALPDGLTHIGDFAFNSCAGVTEIRIPDSVTEMGANPFTSCKHLQKVEISDNHPVFRFCGNGLCRAANSELIWYPLPYECKEVTVPDGVRRIGEGAFRDSILLEKVILPEGLEEIGNRAFEYCYLQDIVFPDSLLVIGDYAFNCGISQTDLVLPDSVRTIGKHAFSSCGHLASIHLPKALTELGEYAFWFCKSLREITIPAGITEIRDSTFDFCENLTSVILPEGLTAIGKIAFGRCANLSNIILPEGLTTIGLVAFTGCGKLETIVIPASVQDFGRKNPFVSSTVWIVTRGSRAEEFCRAYGIEFKYARDEETGRTYD